MNIIPPFYLGQFLRNGFGLLILALKWISLPLSRTVPPSGSLKIIVPLASIVYWGSVFKPSDLNNALIVATVARVAFDGVADGKLEALGVLSGNMDMHMTPPLAIEYDV